MVKRNKLGQIVSGSLYNKTGKEHSRYRHGMTGTKFYKLWCGIMRRCNNKNDKTYKRYGGVGIKVSDSWFDFVNFYNDMFLKYKEGLQIDRIDNSKGYSKENCRWVTLKEQANNKRNVILYTYKGKTMCSSDWDKELGLKEGTVRSRIKKGWDIEKALSEPKRKYIGFSKDKERGGYKVYVKRLNKTHFIGRYKTVKEAKLAKEKWLKEKR